MANLETLELTINANAESARTGIESLITSLSSLSNALIKPYSDLRDFNAELKKMKEYCQSIKLPNIAKATGASNAVAKAKKKAEEYVPKGVNVDAVNKGSPDAVKPEVWKKEYEANVEASHKAHQERINANNEYRQRLKEEAEAAEEASRIRVKEAYNLVNSSSKVDILSSRLKAMTEEYFNNVRAGKLSNEQIANGALKIHNLQEEISKLKYDKVGSESYKKAYEEAKKGIKIVLLIIRIVVLIIK